MSLINDALQRAKRALESQQPSSDPPPEFRRTDSPTDAGPDGLNIAPAVQVTLLLLSLAAVFGLVILGQTRQTVRARTSDQPARVSRTPAAPAAVEPASGQTSQRIPDAPAAAALAPSTASANAAPVVVAASPQPQPPRLQAIIYNPSRPSAVISGKVVFIGDSFEHSIVCAISERTVALVQGNQTNLLTLHE